MSEQNRSLEENKRECEEAAIALANQADASRELDSLMRKKKLASMEPPLDAMESENDLMARFGTERRENRACAIENLECLAVLLDRLPAHVFYGYQMSGFGNFLSHIIRGQWRRSRTTTRLSKRRSRDRLFSCCFASRILHLVPYSTILYADKRNDRRSANRFGGIRMNGYPDRFIEKKWRELEDVPIDYSDLEEPDGVLDTDWFVFKKGEPLIEGVWRWFDSHYTAGIGALMFEAAE